MAGSAGSERTSWKVPVSSVDRSPRGNVSGVTRDSSTVLFALKPTPKKVPSPPAITAEGAAKNSATGSALAACCGTTTLVQRKNINIPKKNFLAMSHLPLTNYRRPLKTEALYCTGMVKQQRRQCCQS